MTINKIQSRKPEMRIDESKKAIMFFQKTRFNIYKYHHFILYTVQDNRELLLSTILHTTKLTQTWVCLRGQINSMSEKQYISCSTRVEMTLENTCEITFFSPTSKLFSP